MDYKYKKVRIAGCSGAGKTYLAKYLSEKYNIKYFDLDDIFWDNSSSYGSKNSREYRNLLLNNILENNCWIIEGIYYNKWVKKTFENADIIYVIHAPAYICIYRIIKRFIKRKLGIEKGKKESFISLISLLYWVFRYNTHEFPKLLLVLDEYSEKVIHLQYKNLLNQISI